MNGNETRAVAETVTLRDYVDVRFEASRIAVDAALAAQKEAIVAALAAADRAVLKAELASDKRFEGVNEFRGTLADQQRTLMPRSEVEVIVKALNEKIAKLETLSVANTSESIGIRGGWGYAVGLLGAIMLIVSLLRAFRP
jgi:hypothetical protein